MSKELISLCLVVYNYYLSAVVAVIGFEQLNYTVNENAGFQEVCVEVFNPPSSEDLLFDIIFSVHSTAGSAGVIAIIINYVTANFFHFTPQS